VKEQYSLEASPVSLLTDNSSCDEE